MCSGSMTKERLLSSSLARSAHCEMLLMFVRGSTRLVLNVCPTIRPEFSEVDLAPHMMNTYSPYLSKIGGGCTVCSEGLGRHLGRDDKIKMLPRDLRSSLANSDWLCGSYRRPGSGVLEMPGRLALISDPGEA
jgi:hypothetical protein